jgi:hypothetical protein
VPAPDPLPPDDIVSRARERAAARAARDWSRADALRAEIEAAGWRIVDRGTGFDLSPAFPPTIEDAGRARYGNAAAVPSLLDAPADTLFSVHLLADDRPDDLVRALAGLRAHAPGGTQVVIVANGPSPARAGRLEPGGPDLAPVAGRVPEVVRTSARLGHAAARNVGLRRAAGQIVVLADTSVEPIGDALTPLAAALADPAVAVTGGFGIVSADLRHFDDAPGPAVDAIERYWLAFRRDDYRALGPLDEKFVFCRHLDVWWSLVLRTGADPSVPPRGARRLDLPLVRHEHRGRTSLSEADRDRLSRRNLYRVLDRFRGRADLFGAGRETAKG